MRRVVSAQPDAQPERHLRVIRFDDNGEVIHTECAGCRDRDDTIAGLERDIRGWTKRNADLVRAKNAEAEEHPCWDAALWLFDYWKRVCRHPRSRWSHDRFWLVEQFLEQKRWGKTLKARVALCRLAIDGAAYDAFRRTRRNGSVEIFDEWERIFANSGRFESFVKRAPADAVERCKRARESS